MSDARPVVVLVDDEGELRAMLSAILRGRQYEVHPFGSAEEALSAVDDGALASLRLAVLDAGLPGVDGLDLARELDRRFPGLGKRTLIITGHDPGPRLVALCDDLDVRVLAKPFRMESFVVICDELAADGA